jgi:predicted Zn-dependent protease with MMP-like domain
VQLEDDEVLLGLYEGIPLTERTSGYGAVLPDKVTIFQRAIEAQCDSEAELVAEVRHTVVHELAHHLGISDERLIEIGFEGDPYGAERGGR